MTSGGVIYRNGHIFDGAQLLDGYAVRFVKGQAAEFGPEDDISNGDVFDLEGDILSPGYVDLQVNGGGGVMFNDGPSVETLRTIAAAHRKLGATAILPTLITDTVEITQAAIAAAVSAIDQSVPGIAGLHLEGPHLSLKRKGAHEGTLIRPMEQTDLAALLTAAEALPVLKVTVAPENVSEDQVKALSAAGVLVSLGHTDADFDTCCRYIAAGARCVTHLFNAMSQLGSRAPGLVGAALASGNVSTGMIADAIHVHPATIRAAWAAKAVPGRIFLVSDAMAVAGSDLDRFDLNGREIRRQEGKLVLADGTLAGADLELTTAINVLVHQVGLPLNEALQAATIVPANLIGRSFKGWGAPETCQSDVIRIRSDLSGLAPLP